MTKIYPQFRWMDEEIIGDAVWVCSCGQSHTAETMTIYDDITCSKCGSKYQMHQPVYLELQTSGEKANE